MLVTELAAVFATAPPDANLGGSSEGGLWDTWAQPLATVVGGSIVAFGAWLGFKVSRESRVSTEILVREKNELDKNNADRDHRREVMAARQDRFTKISEQIASEHEPVRLAGVYALSALADEWQRDGELGLRDVAIDIICAYLRSNKDPKSVSNDRDVRNAAVSTIRQHTEASAPLSWPGRKINLEGALLPIADFSTCDFSGANFTDAVLFGAFLSGANFRGASLHSTDFTSAYAPEAAFQKTTLEGCIFLGTNLTNAKLEGATFRPRMIFGGPERNTETILYGANLSGANLSGTKFYAVKFSSPEPRLPETKFAERITVHKDGEYGSSDRKVSYDEETTWPVGFDIEATMRRQLDPVS